jgi:DNA-binding XRE family transcriptional regulator
MEGVILMQSKLYDIRKKEKLSQQEMADFLDISRVSYGYKERDQLPFNQDEMFDIAHLFKKPISDIFLPRSNRNGYKDGVKTSTKHLAT